jgi:hypothetical protein
MKPLWKVAKKILRGVPERMSARTDFARFHAAMIQGACVMKKTLEAPGVDVQ